MMYFEVCNLEIDLRYDHVHSVSLRMDARF